jgi:cell wall-associated NlpC family hydrolase
MELLIQYAMQFVSTPYKFGSNNPMQGGLDCSGYVCEVLRFAGLVGNREDLTAQMLFDKFAQTGAHNTYGPGHLAFYGDSITKITHVAFMISPYTILEAGGGDSSTTTLEQAAKSNAMVRARLVKYRNDLVATVKPNYRTIGMI